jgi:hypothetical protein
MRILLDESVPSRFGTLLVGHSAVTVQRRGWASIIAGLHAAVPELPAKPDAETVFRTLRVLRNK